MREPGGFGRRVLSFGPAKSGMSITWSEFLRRCAWVAELEYYGCCRDWVGGALVETRRARGYECYLGVWISDCPLHVKPLWASTPELAERNHRLLVGLVEEALVVAPDDPILHETSLFVDLGDCVLLPLDVVPDAQKAFYKLKYSTLGSMAA